MRFWIENDEANENPVSLADFLAWFRSERKA